MNTPESPADVGPMTDEQRHLGYVSDIEDVFRDLEGRGDLHLSDIVVRLGDQNDARGRLLDAATEENARLLAQVERLAGERDEARAAVEHLDLIIERLAGGFAEHPRPDSLSAWNLRADELNRAGARIVGPLFEKWAPQEAAERSEGETDA